MGPEGRHEADWGMEERARDADRAMGERERCSKPWSANGQPSASVSLRRQVRWLRARGEREFEEERRKDAEAERGRALAERERTVEEAERELTKKRQRVEEEEEEDDDDKRARSARRAPEVRKPLIAPSSTTGTALNSPMFHICPCMLACHVVLYSKLNNQSVTAPVTAYDVSLSFPLCSGTSAIRRPAGPQHKGHRIRHWPSWPAESAGWKFSLKARFSRIAIAHRSEDQRRHARRSAVKSCSS